jgi:S-adenosylhomocysteine hydrolase
LLSSAGIYYEPSKRSGQHLLVYNGIRYFRNRKRANKQYWKCSWYYKTKCPAIVIVDEGNECYETQHEHQHVNFILPQPIKEKIEICE